MNTRRRTLAAVAAMGLSASLALAGCAKETDSSPVEQAEGTCLDEAPDGGLKAGQAVKDSFKGVTLTFAAYGGEYQEAQDVAYLRPFSACTGAKILQAQSDTAKLEAMVKSGNVEWNVVYSGGAIVKNKCDELAEPIPDTVDQSESTTGEFSPCQVPVVKEASYLVYNTEEFGDDPPSGMADFFDTEKYPGKRLIYGLPSYPDVFTWGAIASSLGWSEESGEPFPFDEVADKLRSIQDDLVFFTTGAQLVQMLEQGDVAMAFAWSGRAYNAAANGATYTPVYTDMVYGIIDFFVPKGASEQEASFGLVNYMMGAEQQATLTENFVYSPDNKNSDPDVPEDMEPFVPDLEQFESAMNTSTDFFNSPETVERILEEQQTFLTGG